MLERGKSAIAWIKQSENGGGIDFLSIVGRNFGADIPFWCREKNTAVLAEIRTKEMR